MSFTALRRELAHIHTTTVENARSLGTRLTSYASAIREGVSSYEVARQTGVPQDQVLAEVEGFASYSSTRPSVDVPRGWGGASRAAASLASASDSDIAKYVRLRERRSWTGDESPTITDVEWMAYELHARGSKNLPVALRQLVLSQERRPASVFIKILEDLAVTRRELATAGRRLKSRNLQTRVKGVRAVSWLYPLKSSAVATAGNLNGCASVAQRLTQATAGDDAAFFKWLANQNLIYLWCVHVGYV